MKKEIEEKSDEKIDGEEKEGYTKQIYWVLGGMIGLVLVFFFVVYVMQSLRTVEYNGLTFSKENFGDILLYRYSYNAIVPLTGSAVQTKPTYLFLRNDPRENNVLINDQEIAFPKNKEINIAINGTGLLGCEYASVGVASLSGFLASNGFKIKGATMDEQEALENNIEFASCASKPDEPVIEIKSGRETKVGIENNCYVVEISGCDGILPALEKFEVQIVLDAKKRAGL